MYVRRSLETGIKDEGMKNLKRADVCFSMALDVYIKYDKTSQIEQTIGLMTQSMDFRSGAKRTMWNEAIVNEAAASYDDDGDDESGDDSKESESSSFSLEDFAESCVFLDGGNRNDPSFVSSCCDWRMCLTPDEEDSMKDEGGQTNEKYLKVLQNRATERYGREYS